VKQTLVVLIQLHLVVHFTHKEGHRDEVYYECAWLQIYELLHAGKMIAMVEERFGSDGAYIISNMMQMGHVRVSDFLAGSGLSNTPKDTPTNCMTNGIVDSNKPAPPTLASLKAVMGDLLKSRFLIQVQEFHMHPETDVINSVRAKITKQVKESHGAISDLKLKKLVDGQLKVKLREMAVGDTSEHAGMKKRMATVETTTPKRPSKRAKLSTTFEDVSGKEAVWEIDESIVVRVNHEKFLILFRNKELVVLAERRLGKTTAQVYAQLLKGLEDKILRCQDSIETDEDDAIETQKRFKISTLELSRTFDKDIELDNSIAAVPKNISIGKKRARGGDMEMDGIDDGDDDGEDEDEDVDEWAQDEQELNPETAAKKRRMGIIKEHLDLLAQDPYHFVKSEGNRGLGEWSVSFGELMKTMKQAEMEKIIEQRFGGVGLRLLRILQEKGKLDEKQVPPTRN